MKNKKTKNSNHKVINTRIKIKIINNTLLKAIILIINIIIINITLLK